MRARRPLLLALLLALALMPGCGGGDRDEAPPAPAAAPDAPAAGAPPADPSTEIARLPVTVYFAAAGADGLVGETREIYDTGSPVDRAKQIVAALIEGPRSEQSLPALPEGTTFRQLYLEGDTAYVDFGPELPANLGGGSAAELVAVYAVVDSLALNVPEIHRVGLLVAGRPVATLNGHLDLSRPLPPDPKLIVGGA